MFSDRRMILGSLVVLIGLLLFGFFSPISPLAFVSEHTTDHDHEARHEREHVERHEHAERHEHNANTNSNYNYNYNAGDGDQYDYEEIVERTFQVEAGQTLTLDTDLGKVIVRGDGGDEVRVKVLKGIDDVSESEAQERFDRFDLDFDQTSGGIVINGDYDGERKWRRGNRLHVAFEISVPNEFDVDVKTAGGSVMAEDLRGEASLRTSGGSLTALAIDGPVALNTSGGSITAETIGGPARLHTSGGSITAQAVKGMVDANTSGGSITIKQAGGDVEAHTSGGSIRLSDIYGTANAHTSGGSITADLAVAPAGPMKLETSGGGITLRLTEDARVDLDAKAGGGKVRTDMPVTVQGEVKRDRMKGTINGGGPLITLRTSGGGIKIYKR